MQTKICTKCKTEKSVWEFTKRKRNKSGLSSQCKKCTNEKALQRYHKDHNKGKDRNWARGIKRNFNLTPDEWQQIYNKQKGRCIICGKHQSELNRRLCVHHLENNDKIIIIALLCYRCNVGIGCFGHNIKLLERAIKFIKKYH